MTPRELVSRLKIIYRGDRTIIHKRDFTERQLGLGLIVGIASAKSLMEEVQIAKHVVKQLGDISNAERLVTQIVALVCRNIQTQAKGTIPREMAEFLHVGVLSLAKKGIPLELPKTLH